MKIKVNDEVIILAGKDKGKTGKVTKTLKKTNQVIVEGINMVKKHQKPNNQNQNGGIFDMEAPIHVSNVKKTVKDTKKETAKKEEKKVEKKVVAKKEPAKKATKKAKKD